MARSTGNIVDANEISRISSATTIKGDLVSSNDIRIDGNVEGNVRTTGKVVAGESSVITGTVICANADIWGKVEGDLFVKDAITLRKTAQVKGNLHVRKIQIDMDAMFNGLCNMMDEGEFEKLTKTDKQ